MCAGNADGKWYSHYILAMAWENTDAGLPHHTIRGLPLMS